MNLSAQSVEEAGSPPLLRLRGITKRYGSAVALHPVDLVVRRGSFTAILGPSGCGKSTLLRLVAGFADPTTGRIEIDGQDVTMLGPELRPTNMVFQGYGLFPHMTVAENVGFGLMIAKKPRPEIERRVAESLELVRMAELANRRIDALSGGQQQRVALARALIMRPLILLLDEPLAALDLKLRQAMQMELRRIHKETGGTFVFVTHDQSEAFSLADNLIVMNEGRVEQMGAPQDVYMKPKSLFISHFVGDANILKGVRRNGVVELDLGVSFPSQGPSGTVTFILRPEAVRISAESRDGMTLEGIVDDLVLLGNEARVTLSTPAGQQIIARISDPRHGEGLRTGVPFMISWSEDAPKELERAS